MHRLAVTFGLALILAGCSVASSPPINAPTPSTGATIGPATVAPTPTATVRPTPTPVLAAPCPTASPLTVRDFIEADPECFGARDVTIRAWLDTPGPMGFEGPAIAPAWLAYPADEPSALWQAPPTAPDHSCSDAQPGCALVLVHLDPASDLSLGTKPRWLVVTGHLDDPAAETCHYVPGEAGSEEPPPDSYAVEACQGQFVLVSIKDAP